MVAKIAFMDHDGNFIECVLMLGHHNLYDQDYDYFGPITSDIIHDVRAKISYLENFTIDDQTIMDDMLYPQYFSRREFDEELNLHLMSWRKVLNLIENNPHAVISCL